MDDIAQDETRRGDPPQERALERIERMMHLQYDPQDELTSLVDMLSDIRHAVREYNRKHNHSVKADKLVSFFNLCEKSRVAFEAEI